MHAYTPRITMNLPEKWTHMTSNTSPGYKVTTCPTRRPTARPPPRHDSIRSTGSQNTPTPPAAAALMIYWTPSPPQHTDPMTPNRTQAGRTTSPSLSPYLPQVWDSDPNSANKNTRPLASTTHCNISHRHSPPALKKPLPHIKPPSWPHGLQPLPVCYTHSSTAQLHLTRSGTSNPWVARPLTSLLNTSTWPRLWWVTLAVLIRDTDYAEQLVGKYDNYILTLAATSKPSQP
jgi:hypothetical protein